MTDAQRQRVGRADEESFDRQAEGAQAGLFGEFISFVRQRKAYWLVPILVVFLLVGVLLVLGGSPAAPFIYTLF